MKEIPKESHKHKSGHMGEVKTVHHRRKNHPKRKFARFLFKIFLILLSCFLVFITIIIIYVSTLTIPDFSNFANRKIDNSTRIYDRTGKVLLYDVHGDVKRVQVGGDEISKYVKDATVAIEDKYFYTHPSSKK